MSSSIKKVLLYLKTLKDKYARTEALRGKSFAVAKLIKHLKSKPIQTKDGLPLDSINSAADALRVQGCGPLFARMIEANVLNSAHDSSSASAASGAGGSGSKRSRASQEPSRPGSSEACASPPKRARPKANESNTSVLRFAKAGTAGCALLVAMLRLAKSAARQVAWESADEVDLSTFEFCKAEIVREATPLTETQFGSKAPLSAAYASYSDGWKSMSSLVNRTLVQRCRGRGVGHTSTYTLTSAGVVAAEERDAILLSAAAGGAPLPAAGGAQAASPAADTAISAGSSPASGAVQGRVDAVIDLALSSDGTGGASDRFSGEESSDVEIVVAAASDSSASPPALSASRQRKSASTTTQPGKSAAANLDSSGCVSSPDDDSEGLGALLSILDRRHAPAGTSRAGATKAPRRAERVDAAVARAAPASRRGRRAAAVETQAVSLPARAHSEVRRQWAKCDTLFGSTFRVSSGENCMGKFPTLNQLQAGQCHCAGGCSWAARGVLSPQLALVVDAREPASVAGVVTAQCAAQGIPCISFALPVGDFLWAVLPGALARQLSVQIGQCRTVPKQHVGAIKLLGFVAERKRLDDLVNSIVSKVAADGLHRAEKHVVTAGADSSIAATGGSGAIRSRFLMQHWALQRCGLQNVAYVLEGAVGTLRAMGHVPAEKIIKTTIAEGEVAGLAMHCTDSELGTARWLQAQGRALAALMADKGLCFQQLVSVSDWAQHVGSVVAQQLSGQREVFQQQLHQLYRMPTAVACAIAACHDTPMGLRQKLRALSTSVERIRYLTQELDIDGVDMDCSRPSKRVAELLCDMYA